MIQVHDEQWHEDRRKGIGGSDAAAILGIDPYRSPLEVYFEKLGELPPKEENEHTMRGHRLEPVIAQMFEEETGLKVQEETGSSVSKEFPWMRANIDRQILPVGRRGPGVLEIKAPSSFTADQWTETEPTDTAYIQVQHYLAVKGWSWGYIAAWPGAINFRLYPIERNEDLIKILIEKERVFWQEHVLKKIPPEGGISLEALSRLYPQGTGREISIPKADPVGQYIREYYEAKRILDEAKKKKEKAEAEIKKIMADAETGYYSDGEESYMISWMNRRPYNKWDTDALMKNPDLVSKYKTVPVKTREFNVEKLNAQLPKGKKKDAITNSSGK